MHLNTDHNTKAPSPSTAGFTLLESIIVVSIVGILAAIAAPNWFSFINRQRLNTAQYQVYQAMQEAKSNAMRDKVTGQFSIRKNADIVQWAVHPATVKPANTQWHNLDKTINLDPETTLQQSGTVRRIQFDYHGNVKPPLGRVTLSSRNGGKTKRCVFVSTLLGAIRTAKENPKKQDGKYCY